MSEQKERSSSFKKILIIDDEEIFLKPLTKFLTLMKYQVNIATDGSYGIDLQQSIKFDLIITDLKMKNLNGIEVINFLSEKYPETKIIVVSAYVNSEEYSQMIEQIKNNKYVKSVFQKPVVFDELLNKIKEII